MPRSLPTFLAGLVVFAPLHAASPAPSATAKEPAKVLPPVKVTTEVPLEKVAEFHLREKRAAAAAVVSGDHVYVIAGRNFESLLTVERMDLRNGESQLFAKLKEPRRGHRAVLIGKFIYVLGGYTPKSPTHGPTRAIEIIDTETGTVTAGPDMPEGRAYFGCAAFGKKIYVIGGSVRKRTFAESGGEMQQWGIERATAQVRIEGYTNRVIVLDTATGRWSEATPMPEPGQTAAVVVADSSIVVAGGYNPAADTAAPIGPPEPSRRSLAQVSSFNPRDNRWRSQPPLPQPISAHSLAWLGPYLFLFGGQERENELVAYDLRSRTAETYQLGYQPARMTAAVTHEDKVYVIGGSDPIGTAQDLVQVFRLRLPKKSS